MLQETLEHGQALTDAALDRLIPLETQHPVSIHKAMRHSVFAGGKRLRPVLCMEAGRMVAGSLPKKIEELGAALEMLHTYSLIHDDLPALDNDDLRRGRPTCHKVFGEALAILAGDALQTQAYEVMARLECPAEARVRIIEEVARGTGTRQWHDRWTGRGSGSRAYPTHAGDAGIYPPREDGGADHGESGKRRPLCRSEQHRGG